MNLWLAAGLLFVLRPAVAMFEPQIVSFEQLPGALDISKPVIVVDGQDYTGVQIAAHTLAADFGNVTKAQPTVQVLNGTNTTVSAASAIIIGTLSNSPLLQTLVSSGKLNVSAIEGKWESFVTSLVTQPLDGIDSALVIAGSDKRGAIFGAYTVSEQIGVSPWYWWADVPILSKSKIFALPIVTLHGEPSVKFRGIFINDEAPALTSWVLEKFGSKYNVEFYKRVFELLLRLKANYLWPAMWPGYPYPGNSFFVDDPLNQKTADDYGIVVSTSHHEPMQRATNEWLQSDKGQWDWASNKANISQFFREGAERAKSYDSYFTVGMRGDGDSPISGTDPKALMEDIINTQRSIITEVYGNSTAVNQVWALYKEVQAIYDQGLQVPDDITLLFADDNFGNIRRLATQTERQRSGGSGIYYHMEYVGSPISYKWLNTNSLGKIHHQLSLAKMTGTDRIWVFNVADIKPMEVPLTFALTFAYNHTTISTDSIPEYLLQYARREIPDASEADVEETSDLLLSHSRLMGIRKHEHTEQSVFSVLNYREADRWASVWDALNKRADSLSARVSQASSAAFFQLVLQPIKASQIFYTLRVAQARNNLFGQERANTANVWADRTLELFDKDYDIEEEYHSLLHGKWNHIMAQAHYGYVSSWVPPIRNMITGMYYVQRRQKSVPAVGNIGVRIDGSAGSHVGLFNEGNHLSQPSREPSLILPLFSPYNPVRSTWVLLYARGPGSMRWFSSTSQPWVSMSPSQGTLDDHTTDQLVNVTVDWSSVPDGFNSSVILKINSTDAGSYEEVTLPLVKVAPDASFAGHVQADGVVSILAPHFVESTAASDGTTYHVLPHLGRSIEYSGAVGLLPYNATVPSIPDGPYLDYSFYLFNPVPSTLTVTLYFTMCQDPLPDAPLKYGLSLDGGAVNTTQLIPTPATAGDLPAGWTTVVQNLVWDKAHTFTGVGSGGHTLRYWAGNVGVLLEKIVVNVGGLRTSYLGPPESMRLGL